MMSPTHLDTSSTELIDNDPVIAGSFADIYKDYTVCLKLIRVCDSSQVDYTTEVRLHKNHI
jgi:hypothetical protein